MYRADATDHEQATRAVPPATRVDLGRLTLLYDGDCPLCRREIGFYSALAGAEHVDWVDVSRAPVDALPADVTREAALARLHAVEPDGRVLTGAGAFLAVWWRLRSFRWLARVLDRPALQPPLEAAYRLFLRVRPHLQRLAGGARRSTDDCSSACRR